LGGHSRDAGSHRVEKTHRALHQIGSAICPCSQKSTSSLRDTGDLFD
jgi:hypothetical protein